MQVSAKIYVAGHRGMVGSALVRLLKSRGYHNIVTRSSDQLDLRDQQAVSRFFSHEKPEYVLLAAAKVGGILANNRYRADFIYDNLMIQSNVIHQAYLNNVRKLVFLGSSCIYPKMAVQPMDEKQLLTGELEYTNEPYAIAKIAGLKMCDAYRDQYGCNFISVMPTNLYGPNDNYDLQNSHVLPALIRKFKEAVDNDAEEVVIWGSGKVRREFLHVDDFAAACLFLMERFNQKGFVNIGVRKDLTISELAELVKDVSGFTGNIRYDLSKPDGTPRKLLNVSLLHSLGWHHSINLEEGIAATYSDYVANHGSKKLYYQI